MVLIAPSYMLASYEMKMRREPWGHTQSGSAVIFASVASNMVTLRLLNALALKREATNQLTQQLMHDIEDMLEIVRWWMTFKRRDCAVVHISRRQAAAMGLNWQTGRERGRRSGSVPT